MKKSSVLFVLMAASGICFSSVYAQKRLVLDLNQTIALANDSSLESFRTKYVPVRLLGIPDVPGKPFAESDNGPYSGTI